MWLTGQPQQYVEVARAQLARGNDTTYTRQGKHYVRVNRQPVRRDEARLAANGLIEAAEATRNPYVLAFALLAGGWAVRDADPVRSVAALRRGLVIAQDSGNSFLATQLVSFLSGLEFECGDPLAALDHLSLAIHNHQESGTDGMIATRWLSWPPFSTGTEATNRRPPSPATPGSIHWPRRVPDFGPAITHLRDVLGEARYETLARKGETMPTAEMVNFAYDQIDQARAELNAVPK